MQIGPFNHSDKQVRWDEHRAFHIKQHHTERGARGRLTVTTFDTGEVMVSAYSVGATVRGTYRAHQFTLFTARDIETVPRLTLPDGEEIPKAWLMPSVLFLHDHDTNHVVPMARTTPYIAWDGGLIPPRLRDVGTVYFMGTKAAPQAHQAITITRIVPPTPDERRHINTMRNAARLWCTLITENQHAVGDTNLGHKYQIANNATLPSTQVLAAATLDQLPEVHRLMLASFGVHYPTVPFTVPYLLAIPRNDA